MYEVNIPNLNTILASVKDNKQTDPLGESFGKGNLLLSGGHIVDPKNNIDEVMDILISNDQIVKVAPKIEAETHDKIINCEGLLVVPGLIDMHLHLCDLFEVTTDPIHGAVQDGVTMGLSPGAGNTFLAPSLLGAEIDRGLPLNAGLYLGAPSVLGSMLTVDELILMFKGELDFNTMATKMTRNSIAIATAALTVGIKDHMGHFLMSDENIEKIFSITSESNLIYMSHTQDPAHSERMVKLAKGRNLHLGHTNAAGCGSHDTPESGMKRVIELCKEENVSGELVTTMLRKGLGSLEGLRMTKESQKLALDSLANKTIDILVSDGQNQSTMKGFGDTRDNIPALLELAEEGVLSLSDSIATMTANPAKLLADRTKNDWWTEKNGHLGVGALANVTIIDKCDKLASYTIVNGKIVSFESRIVRRGSGAGRWISRFGDLKTMGVGDISAFSYKL